MSAEKGLTQSTQNLSVALEMSEAKKLAAETGKTLSYCLNKLFSVKELICEKHCFLSGHCTQCLDLMDAETALKGLKTTLQGQD